MNREYDVQLIENLDQYLKEYDKIVLFSGGRRMNGNLRIPAGLGGQNPEDGIPAKFCSFIRSQNRRDILVLPSDKYKALAKLYCTYEFSDRIRMMGGNRQHGSLMNYVSCGLLTEEEMFEAVLW